MTTTSKQTQKSPIPALLTAIIDAWRLPDLRFRILFTLFILVVFRFFAHVPVPGVDREALAAAFEANPLLGFLDLFSGVGSFGLEAVSRGVKKVVFFEDYKPAIKLLNKNISLLSFNKETEVYNKNIYNKNNFRILKYKFNLIFLDPPFKDGNIVTIINNLINARIVVKDTLILIHRHKKTKDNFNQNLKIIREETYGFSKIIFGYFNFEEF